jgi:DNA-binding LacI/PurR family transcriptional regulator
MARRKKIALKDIATASGFSVSTVSLVLNNRAEVVRIADDTQQRIRKIANDMGYESDSIQEVANIIPISRKNIYHIGIFITDSFLDLPLELFNSGLKKFQEDTDYPFFWSYIPYNPNHLEDFAELFSSKVFDGIIITTPYENDAVYLGTHKFNLPIVLLNYQINGYTCVCHDDYEIGRKAAEIFYQRKKRCIAVIAPTVCTKGISTRIAGFNNYLINMGFPTEQLHLSSGRKKNSYGGYEAAKKLYEGGIIPDALYIINDLMTTGVLSYLRENHVKIPNDVEILSYGDVEAPYSSPSVSSFSTQSPEMAYSCMEDIFQELQGLTQPGQYRSYSTNCNWRESCVE